jgi:3-hydroxyisobutyrate dehydrogenase
MSKTIVLVGPAGSGAMIKLINNFVCGVQIIALAEAVTMIERSGLDRSRALEILTQGAPGSPLVKSVSARMNAADYTPNFLLRLMAKDLDYSIQEAGKLSIHLATAQSALDTFQRAVAAGHGEKDIAAAVELVRAEKGR